MAFSVAGFPVLYVLATTVLVIILVTRIVAKRRTNLPPGPTGLPLLGSLHLLSPLPHQSLAELAKKYGPLMSLRLGQAQCIVASSPAAAMEFLKKQDANFCARPPLRAGQVVMGPDILCQNNSPVWRHMRKIFHMKLTGTKRLEATRHVREEEMATLLRTLPRNQEFELRSHVGALSTNIISRLVLNRRFSAPTEGHEDITEEQMLEVQNFRGIMEAIPKCLSAFYPADFIPALKWFDFQGLDRLFKETNKRMEAFATKIISEHQEQRQRGPVAEHEKDMVHILLDEVDSHNGTDKSGPQITMDNVRSIMWDAFGAATETITTCCEWIMSELVSNPNTQSSAQAELATVLAPNRRVRESDLPHLPYLLAIIKEGLRLHPPAPVMVPHQSIASCEALGYDIPAHARLFVNVWAIGRDPTVWEDPLKFNPDRWLQLGKEEIDGTWLPFGAGRRSCPGMALGNVALQYSVASLLQAFEWEGSSKEDQGIEEAPGMSVPRAVPLRVVAKPRLPAEFYN